jgi:membrane protease YdiL (CAAX protease family)
MWGIGGWCAAIAAAATVGCIADAVFQGIPEAPHPIGQAVEQAGAWEMVCIFLVACVVAPVVEETFFRGVLFMGLWRRLQSFWKAAVLAGAAFAMLHPTLFAGLFPLACVGIVGCVLMRERRSLAACMVMHSLFNTTTLVIGLMMR